MPSKIKLAAVLILIPLFLLVYNKIDRKNNLTFSSLSIPNHLNSHMTISYNDVVIIDNLFPRLFKRNSTLEYYGEVADEWYINKDLKKLEIKIKQKMFSDGSNISVDDIVLSIKDAINPSTLNSFFFKNIKDVRTISSNRLEIDYIGWEGLLFQQLSSPFLSIYKNGVAPTKQSPDSWLVKMPLKIETWTNDSLKILNSDKNITLFLTAPNSENIRNLDVVLSRESPVIAGTNLFEDEYFKNNFNSYSFDTYNTKIILLNEKIPHNTRVCISHLISNSDNINKIYKNHRSSSLIPQGVLGYAPQKQNDRLVNKNLKLISLVLIERANEVINGELIDVLTSSLANCRVDLKVNKVSNGEYYQRLLTRNYDIAIATISTQYNDPTFILSFFHSGSKINLTGTNKIIGEAIDNVSKASNRQDVVKSAIKAQQLIHEYAVAIPLATLPTYSFVRKPFKIKSDVFFDIIRWEDFYE